MQRMDSEDFQGKCFSYSWTQLRDVYIQFMLYRDGQNLAINLYEYDIREFNKRPDDPIKLLTQRKFMLVKKKSVESLNVCKYI